MAVFRFSLLFLALVMVSVTVYARPWLSDVENRAGRKLNMAEVEIAQTAGLYYLQKSGKPIFTNQLFGDAINTLNDNQYSEAVDGMAAAATNGVLKQTWKAGRWGEKLLKTIIIDSRDAARKARKHIEERARQYDQEKEQLGK